MKKCVFVFLLILIMTISFSKANVDTMTSASGNAYYAEGSYSYNEMKELLESYPYPFSVTVATTNKDGSPNISTVIPGISKDGKYFVFGLANNRTRENFLERELAMVSLYEYNPTAVEKINRNRGCRIVLKYVGDKENNKLNKKYETKSLYMEIIKLLPLG
ncbi:hypothetical protein [Oceanotoga teriensis]|jgi:hypothetical protein|uniref:hypothetical protein n=1 Tax=Oceanotoga teriensis TaxID=515440 RepID=UPI0027133A15|nr:hypothetical protein [Oceanotoga teriensis]MDO7976528.1 hypothetical protein [Oceanotoga teriensis]